MNAVILQTIVLGGWNQGGGSKAKSGLQRLRAFSLVLDEAEVVRIDLKSCPSGFTSISHHSMAAPSIHFDTFVMVKCMQRA